MKKILFNCLVFLSLLAIGLRFGLKPVYSVLGYQDRAGLKITSNPSAKIVLNGNQVGKTPFEDDNLTSGNYHLKLDADTTSWEGDVSLNKGTLTVVNRELDSSITPAGEILTLVSGSGALVTSSPQSAELLIDGKDMGITPLSLSELNPGEHEFTLTSDHYSKRGIKAKVPDNMKLWLDMDLSLIQVSTEGLAALPEASATAVVKNTPNGFLRVRDQPSLSGAEIGRVNEGDSLVILETQAGWVKVQLSNGSSGYVSSDYLQKQ